MVDQATEPGDVPETGAVAQVLKLADPIPARPTDEELVRPPRLPEFWRRPHVAARRGARAKVRDVPYVLRGRDHETAFMAQSIHNMPFPVQLISGPPGAGKTSLLRNIGRYAAAQGYRVVELNHTVFRSDTGLADVIDTVTFGRAQSPDTVTRNQGERAQTGLLGSGIGGETGWQESKDQRHPKQWMDALLREAANPVHRGLVILLDEVQLLGTIPEGSETHGRILSFLQFMHNAILPGADGPGHRTVLIAAGLQNGTATLEGFGLTRIEGQDIVHMGPISDTHAKQIIRDHLTATTESGNALPQLPEDTIDELVRMCGGYAHHISHAAQAAQSQAVEALSAGRTVMESADIDAVIEQTQSARRTHYGGRVNANETNSILAPVQIIAQATESWGERLPARITEDLIDKIMAEKPVRTDDLRRDVVAKGILERRDGVDGYPTAVAGDRDEAHYVFPIPSMVTWLIDKLDEPVEGATIRQENQKLIDTMAPPRAPEQRISAWTWDHTKPIAPLEPMPPDEAWDPNREVVLVRKPQAPPSLDPPKPGESVAVTADAVKASVETGVQKGLEVANEAADPHTPLGGKVRKLASKTLNFAKRLARRAPTQEAERNDLAPGGLSAAIDGPVPDAITQLQPKRTAQLTGPDGEPQRQDNGDGQDPK